MRFSSAVEVSERSSIDGWSTYSAGRTRYYVNGVRVPRAIYRRLLHRKEASLSTASV